MKKWKNIAQLILSAQVWMVYLKSKSKDRILYVIWTMFIFWVAFIILFVALGVWDILLILLSYLKTYNHG
jgi:hypothetical protein